MLNTAVVTPIPSANARMASADTDRVRMAVRTANRTSCPSLLIPGLDGESRPRVACAGDLSQFPGPNPLSRIQPIESRPPVIWISHSSLTLSITPLVTSRVTRHRRPDDRDCTPRSVTRRHTRASTSGTGPSLAQRGAKGDNPMLRNTYRLVFAVLLIAAAATTAFAQQTTGNITGRVLDEQKGAVPGATVTVKNAGTGFTRSEVSDSEGVYRITGLPVGSYALTLEMSGFQPQTRTVQVSVSETVTSDFNISIAKVTEAVNVTAETPLVDTTSSAVGGVVDTSRVDSLPP